MAQGAPGGVGPQLVCVDALWCGTANFGSLDAQEGCFCGDAGGYVIKKDAPDPYTPHNEWLCSNLATKVGVPQLGFDIVRHVDGNMWFGSSWKNSKVIDWWLLAQAGKINIDDLREGLSRIYILDLFIHNVDRHMNNYFVVLDGADYRIFSFDYGRAWRHHGWPLPPVMTDPALNTVNNKNWLKQTFPTYFDAVAANETLDRLGAVTSGQIEEIIAKEPANWLQEPLISDTISWWAAHASARLDQIRIGIGNGTLL